MKKNEKYQKKIQKDENCPHTALGYKSVKLDS